MLQARVQNLRYLSSPENRTVTYRVEPSLYLRVQKSGSKSFVQKLTVGGKRFEMGLGGFPDVTFAEARNAALQNRATVAAGGDPRVRRKALYAELARKANVPTFSDLEREVFALKSAGWKGKSAVKVWQGVMGAYALPAFGHKSIDAIGKEDVLSILVPLWTTKPAYAKKLRQYVKAVFDHAVAHGHRDSNPAGDAISGALPRQKAVQAHHAALPWKDVPAALEAIDAADCPVAARAAFRFMVLTASRSAEAMGATWDEIDGDVWKIPGSRMKTGREHRVPLSAAAVAVLETMRPLADGSGLIFPGQRPGTKMSDATFRRVRVVAGIEGTSHGFRSSFRDWCAEAGKPREIAEAALAHVVGGVEGAYFRSDLFDRRRAVMDQWAAHCTATPAKVIKIA